MFQEHYMKDAKMKILVATRNNDKFEIVKRLVQSAIKDSILVNLASTEIEGDVVEVGTIRERAIQKAKYFHEKCSELATHDEFAGVLAVDDGLAINGAEASPNSKELTDQILSGAWKPGTMIDVVRAFALIIGDEVPRAAETHVPFEFIGNPNEIKREDGRYPLSKVFAIPGDKVPVSELSPEAEDAYYSKFTNEHINLLFQ